MTIDEAITAKQAEIAELEVLPQNAFTKSAMRRLLRELTTLQIRKAIGR